MYCIAVEWVFLIEEEEMIGMESKRNRILIPIAKSYLLDLQQSNLRKWGFIRKVGKLRIEENDKKVKVVVHVARAVCVFSRAGLGPEEDSHSL